MTTRTPLTLISVLLFLTVVLIVFAQYHYQTELQYVASNTPIQCGHLVYAKTCQLLGMPVTSEDIRQLPSRKIGLSMSELKEELRQKGVESQLKFEPDFLTRSFDEFVICKLVEPDHFVLLNDAGENSVNLLSEGKRLYKIKRKELSRRFKGYCLVIDRDQAPVRKSCDSVDQPLPQFDTLRIDVGALKFKDYENKNVLFDFKLKNVGERPLQVLNIESSCTCTRMRCSKDPIAPGEEITLSASYRSSMGNTDGDFVQQIFIETNSPAFPVVGLEVAGRFPGRMSCIPNMLRVQLTSDFAASPATTSYFLMVDHPPELASEDLEFEFVGIDEDFVSVHASSLSSLNQHRMKNDPYFIRIPERQGMSVFEVRIHPEILNAKWRLRGHFVIKDASDMLGTARCEVRTLKTKRHIDRELVGRAFHQ